MTRFFEAIRRHPGLTALVAACVVLPLGTWGPGLWDPWEMNRAHVARRMAEAPSVLVVEARPRADTASIASSLTDALADDASVASTSDTGAASSAIETARTQLSDHIWRVVVVDLDSRMKSAGDQDGRRPILELLKAGVPDNASTTFLLVSSSGTVAPGPLKAAAVEAARASASGDADERAGAIESRVRTVASVASVTQAVEDALPGDGFIAQFKAKGRTVFTPPLDPFVISLSMRALGQSELSARLPGVIWSILALILLYLVASRAFGEHDAALAILVMATAPLFFEAARFVANEQSTMLFLATGAVAFGAIATGRGGRAALPVLLGSTVLLWLCGGMLAVTTLAAIAVVYPIVGWDGRRQVLVAAGAVAATGLALAALTFIPDAAFFRQFRFTESTFAGGMPADARAFDFPIKEVGFGMFPWSALLPLSVVAVLGGGRQRPDRTVLLLWGVVPLVVLMIAVRPFFHTLYAGVPALALMIALYLRESEDDPVQSRLLAFFGFGLFLVMFKDTVHSPSPLVSFLTRDPMFAQPGKGDLVFPPVGMSDAARGFALVAGFAILVGGGRLVSLWNWVERTFREKRRAWRVAQGTAVFLALLDIVIFLGLKWDTLSGADTDVPAVLLRILLTGPDILFLYFLNLVVFALGHWPAVRRVLERVVGPARVSAGWDWLLRLERPRVMAGAVGVGATGLALVLAFHLVPELSYHVSQKHIMQTYRESAERAPGELFRHGIFGGRGSEDSNFYTAQIKDMPSRAEVIDRLKDTAHRTFFLVPKAQWSELDSAFRAVAGGRFPPVLDDRSSRFILVASSLAPGEVDHNWLAKATLTQAQFDALPDVNRELVNFDNRIELVGYSLDAPAVRRGGTATIKMYFKALQKVGASYRIFMHIDRQGSSSRIHGDHWIDNLVRESEEETACVGCYATSHWLPGDIVVDTYEIEVPIGSPSGPHDMWIGFYTPGDDKRLPVKEYDRAKVRHDGQNRVRIGILTVE